MYAKINSKVQKLTLFFFYYMYIANVCQLITTGTSLECVCTIWWHYLGPEGSNLACGSKSVGQYKFWSHSLPRLPLIGSSFLNSYVLLNFHWHLTWSKCALRFKTRCWKESLYISLISYQCYIISDSAVDFEENNDCSHF